MALDDELLNKLTWKIPNALALIGSRAGEERNAMTASWITQLSMEPVLLGVGVDIAAVTHRLITDGGSFTINLWNAEDTRVFVKFSKAGDLRGRHPERSADQRGSHRCSGIRRGNRLDRLRGASVAQPWHPHTVRR